MTQRLTLAVFLAAVSGGLLAAQQPAAPPDPVDQPEVTFRVEVNYVEVDAFVTDADGNPVTDLTLEDFEVREGGTPQEVSAFSLVNIPVERVDQPLFAETPVEADVQSNEHVEGRIYLLVLDDWHTDITRGPRVKAAARRFIEQDFGENDLAAVVFIGNQGHGQDFTNNRRLLLESIEKFTGQKLRSAVLNRIEAAQLNPTTNSLEPGQDIDELQRVYRARTAMKSVRDLAEFMAGVRGRRKAMLLIGEGVDYNIYEAVGQPGASASSVILDTHDAISSATRGNVSIYAIDPRGLSNADAEFIEVSEPLGDANLQASQSAMRMSQDSLRVLADATGGFAALNRNDFGEVFSRIVTENSTYYMLGYYSTNESRNGRFRDFDVRVKRPGLRVRHRNGYYAARGRAPAERETSVLPDALSPPVAEALGSPLPMAGMPIRVFAAPFKGAAPDAAVALSFGVGTSSLPFENVDGTFNSELEVAYSAVSRSGKVFPGDRHNVKLTLKPETYERVQAGGIHVVSQVSLPPGRYQLRVAAGNRTGTSGSVLYDLEVPDFTKEAFSMSGVALTSLLTSQQVTIRAKDPLADFLPGPPTTEREFEAADTIVLFAEFYEAARATPAHTLDFTAELRAEGGLVVQAVTDERSSSELQGSAGGYGFTATLPLDDVDPGLYVIRVEGRSRDNPDTVARRDIQIRVR